MPAAVFVAEPVIRKGREHLWLAGWSIFASLVTIANESIGEGEIEPRSPTLIRVESDVVRVAQAAEIFRHFVKLQRLAIELVEDIDHAASIVGEVEHIRDKESIVRTERHEAHAFQSLSRDADLVTIRKIQVKRLSIGERDVMWCQTLGRGRDVTPCY